MDFMEFIRDTTRFRRDAQYLAAILTNISVPVQMRGTSHVCVSVCVSVVANLAGVSRLSAWFLWTLTWLS